ncbi:MAG: TetR family transcriptional regulator [Lachnospiraceae bacterium]|nr:TetR family transcriptional regulator [Lachnospiraceae bacterium]
MPSSPKIPKETILKHALEMLIQDGYSSINIKTLAKKIGCSTQPISWHFGHMENFRSALTEYALHYANEKMLSASERMTAFSNAGIGYIDIAVDEPNLFRYLYMSGESGYHAGGFDILTTADENSVTVKQIAEHARIPVDKVNDFFKNTIIYAHGLACFIVSGLIKATKEELYAMVNQGAHGFMLQAGFDFHREADNGN